MLQSFFDEFLPKYEQEIEQYSPAERRAGRYRSEVALRSRD